MDNQRDLFKKLKTPFTGSFEKGLFWCLKNFTKLNKQHNLDLKFYMHSLECQNQYSIFKFIKKKKMVNSHSNLSRKKGREMIIL
jgi:hypothetical protein